jgi:hypothetical protein
MVPARTARLVLVVLIAAAVLSVGATRSAAQPQALFCTTYFVSGDCSNPVPGPHRAGDDSGANQGWQISANAARRLTHYVWVYDGPGPYGCLPGFARIVVRNTKIVNNQLVVINTRYGSWGACGLTYDLSSGTQKAYAECKVETLDGVQFVVDIACGTKWRGQQ